jgi:hypothetical protein
VIEILEDVELPVVVEIFDRMVVGIRAVVAHGADAVAIAAGLVRIRLGGAVVTDIPEPVMILIELIVVVNERAIIRSLRDEVAVGVGAQAGRELPS